MTTQRQQRLGISPRSQNLYTFTLPWNGKIISPTPSQLRKVHDNLDLFEKIYGSRDPLPEEHKLMMRMKWKNYILWPTVEEFLSSRGDLNVVIQICATKIEIPHPKTYFPTQSESSKDEKLGSLPLIL